MNLVIRKPGWAIPPDTPVAVLATFPDGSSLRLPGKGKGNTIEILVEAGQLPAWVHGLTASSSMQLSFGGSEPAWTFDLTGTTPVVNAMDACFRAHHITAVDAPFSAEPAQVETTQPFGQTPLRKPTPSPAQTAAASSCTYPDLPRSGALSVQFATRRGAGFF